MSAKRGNNERDFLLTIIVLIIIGFYAAVKDERHIRDKRYKHLKNILQQHEIKSFESLKESTWTR
jgi:hypothetical protein